MIYISVLSFNEIREKIDKSNLNAAENNRNLYPIQEQATLMEIWENINCSCEVSCCCSHYNRKQQWKLKNGLVFNDIICAYLRMFVDSRKHNNILNILKQDTINYNNIPKRIKGAVESLVSQFVKVYIKQNNIHFFYPIHVFHMIMLQGIRLRNS